MKTRCVRRGRRPCGVLVAALLASVLGTGPCAHAESLRDAVQEVIDAHPTVRSSNALLDAAGEQLFQAKSNFYPSVGVEAQVSDERDRQLGSGLDRKNRSIDGVARWNLFRGLADWHTMRMARHDRDAADEDLSEAHEKVALQVAAAYLEVLRLRQRLVLANAFVSETKRLGDDVAKLIDAGKAPTADADQVDVGLVEAEWEVAQLRGQLVGAEKTYELLTGHRPGELGDPEMAGPMSLIDRDAMMEQVLAENPKVRASKARAEARSEEIGVAGSALLPEVNLEFRKRLKSDITPDPVVEVRNSTQVMLNYEMPLGGGSFSRKREAAARMEAARAEADQAILDARTSLGQLWNNWAEARDIAPSLSRRAAASEKVVTAYDQQFGAGRRTLQDLIAVRNAHFRARADVIENRASQQVGAAQLLSLLGRLRATVDGESPLPDAMPEALDKPKDETEIR